LNKLNFKKVVCGVSLGTVMVLGSMSSAFAADINHPTAQTWTVDAAPTLSAVIGTYTSTLPTGTYYVRYTYVTDRGETPASAEASVYITEGQNLQVVVPALPAHASSINIYISSTTNTETFQINTTSTTYDQSLSLETGVAYPTTSSISHSHLLIFS
jgi:hypothetical protein